MIVQVRTSRDLLDTLRIGMSPAWKVSKASLRSHGTTRVHVVNWNGSVRIEGDYSEELSVENHPDHPPGRTVIALANAQIALCRVDFPNPRNPISYHEDEYEQTTRAEPYYRPVYGWPPPSRDEALALYDEMDLADAETSTVDANGIPDSGLQNGNQRIASEIAGDAYPRGYSEYRHWLSRTWDANGATALVIGINPSKATDTVDDPMTGFLVRLMSSLSGDFACGEYVLVNCCDLRSPNPDNLRTEDGACSPENLATIQRFLYECDFVVASWGTTDYGPVVADMRIKIVTLVRESGKKVICFSRKGAPIHCSRRNKNTQVTWSDEPIFWSSK
jgi:hypothetical protein